MRPLDMLNTPRISQEIEPRALLQTAYPIAPVQIQTTATTIYTAPAGSDFMVKHLSLTNVTASPETYSLHLVPDGGSAATANAIAIDVALAANTVVEVMADILVPPGTIIQALCGTNDAVNAWGWGYDLQGDYAG